MPLLLGFSGGYLVPAEDSTEKAIWNYGGKCEESFEGILFLFLFFWGEEEGSFIIVHYRRNG